MRESGKVRSVAGLSEGQLHVLRERLERLRDELGARVRREQAVARKAERLSEPLDAAEQTREQDDAVVLAAHDREQLREVEHALAKMASGRYGISEVSGDPIPFERLLAVPWARYDADEDQAAPL